MRCPYCSSSNISVVDTRPVEDANSIRRRRVCQDCGRRFTSYETIEKAPLYVIKKDNSREPYDRNKLLSGISRSCYKCPVSIDQINSTVDDIEAAIYAMGEREISTNTIGEMVMEKLKDLDAVAYIRFASVYREFKDVDTFIQEIGKFKTKED